MFSPQAKRRWQRFKSIKRGYYSFIAVCILIFVSLFAEIWVNNRPIIIHYNDSLYFPSYGDILPGNTFGFDYNWETNYQELSKSFEESPESGTG